MNNNDNGDDDKAWLHWKNISLKKKRHYNHSKSKQWKRYYYDNYKNNGFYIKNIQTEINIIIKYNHTIFNNTANINNTVLGW